MVAVFCLSCHPIILGSINLGLVQYCYVAKFVYDGNWTVRNSVNAHIVFRLRILHQTQIEPYMNCNRHYSVDEPLVKFIESETTSIAYVSCFENFLINCLIAKAYTF